ncbi:outer membrane protein assembly factor BamA [bacterium]|nr:outer membrane protein assembly factor BamA [bacterium]
MMKKYRYIVFLNTFFIGSFCMGKSDSSPDKLIIHELAIEGSQFFRKSTLKQMMVSRPGWLWQQRIYRPELLQEDLENLERIYHQHGFLEAQITSYNVNIDSADRRVAISVRIYEGNRTFVEGVHLFGNQAYSDSVLESQLKISVGHALVARDIDQSQNQLMRFYAENGYLDAQVTVNIKTNPESHRAILDFSIIEQRISRLKNIHTRGIDKVRPNVVLRELKLDSGAVIQYSKLLKSQRKLYLTGLFQYAYVKPAPWDSTRLEGRDIIIEVQEHPYGEYNLSGGYGSEDKFRIKMEIAHKNINGTARKLGFQSWLSFIRRGVMISMTDPWLFQQPVKADLNLSIEFNHEPGYNLFRSGGQGILGYHVEEHSDLRLTIRQDFSQFSRVKTLPKKKSKGNIRSLKFSMTHDTRENLFDPHHGIYLECSYELARAVFEAPVLFHRWEGEFRFFFPCWRYIIGTGLEFGYLKSRASIESIPLNERYYVGGQGSVRGFDYQKIGPLNEKGTPTGGLIKLVWHIGEIRFPFFKSLQGAVFCDAGNCWSAAQNAQIKNLRSAAGFGLRFHSFLGIIRMDYAHKLDKRTGEKEGALIFNMGHAF